MEGRSLQMSSVKDLKTTLVTQQQCPYKRHKGRDSREAQGTTGTQVQ